jgi:DNA polymerase III delta prime subunit
MSQPTPTPSLASSSPDRRGLRVDQRLKEALESGSLPRDVLISGPAGTGKTYAILATLHCLAADYPNLRILICRATRASLTQSALVTYEQEILAADGMEFIASGASRRTRQSYVYPNGSEIALGGLDKPDKILSSAWDVIYVNEAIETVEEAWEKLSSRLRRPGRPAWLGYLIGDTNPGDPSHWLKKRADAGNTVLWDTTFEANPGLHDGTGWTAAGVAHIENLDRLTASRKKRLRHGLWAAGEGAWFDGFDDGKHVGEAAEFDPNLPVHLGIDSGSYTGAVWFQVRPGPKVTVFADYLSYNAGAHNAALEILRISGERCGGRIDHATTDPAGKSTTAIGVTVFEEYKRAGLRVQPWPIRSVLDSLSLVESFVSVDPPELLIHPRCRKLIDAFGNYKRAKRQGQWVERPEDPQHPYEDVMDAFRGGLCDKFPHGRKIEPKFARRSASVMS